MNVSIFITKYYHYIEISVLIMVFCLLVSCTAQTITSSPTELPKELWLKKFLTEPTCQPPCWENISPGKSTIAQTYEILKSTKDVADLKIWGPIEGPQFDKRVDISWNFGDKGGSGLVISDENGEIVSNIFFRSEALTLDDIRGKYGDPEKILINPTPSTSMKDIYIIYTRYNMVVDTWEESKNGVVNLQKGKTIFRFSFNQAGWIEQFIKKLPSSKLFDWHGYGDYTMDRP